jgi:predicted ATP-grasp superfamily ATP-dependent carboligase
MGPAFDPHRVSTAELFEELVPFLEQRFGISYIEMLHSDLDPAAMRSAGFTGEPVCTYRARLYPGEEERALRAMKDSARRNVRRAQRLGLVVRMEDDERFVDEHYDQLRDVYLRGGNTVPFSKQRVLECFRHMKAAGKLIATSVYLPGGRVNIATGMFFMEGPELLLWMWAHRHQYRWYRPTELMTWAAMQHAMRQGCQTFDFMGRGDFKAKLGAEPDLSKFRWMRSRHRWLTRARAVAETGYRWQQSMRGRAVRLAGRARALFAREPQNGHPPACVLGDIDLVRTLGLAGIGSAVVAPPGTPARFSRHTRHALPWKNPVDHPEELVETLIAYGEAQPEPPVLFYQDDSSLLLVSRYRDRLRNVFRFIVPDARLVEQLVDKGQFQELAAKKRLPVPPARVLRPAEEPMPGDLGIRFPLVLKPLTRLPTQWEPAAGECKAVRADTSDEVLALWPKLAAAKLTVLAQELIPGSEARVESYHTYVDERGEIVAEFTGRKIRTSPLAYGDSTAIEITDVPDVQALGRELVRRLGLRGVAKLDFKRGPDPEGLLYLLEINARFTLWHHPGAIAGVNVPALVYGDLVGSSRPTVARARTGVRWCRPWKDIHAARASGMSLVKWLPWALRCEAKAAVAWDDPLPLLAAGLWRGLAAFRRTTRRTTERPQLALTPVSRSEV